MGNRYIVQLELAAPTKNEAVLEIIPAASRRARVCEVTVGGRGTSSAYQRASVVRATTAGTGSSTTTPVKFDHVEQPAAASTVNTAWSGQPTEEAHGEEMTWNALGGSNRWLAPKGSALEATGTGDSIVIFIPNDSGLTTQAMSLSVVFEED